MSYEEDYRIPYSATCACGRGKLRYYLISSSNDWGQTRKSSTAIEWECDCCKNKYNCESIHEFRDDVWYLIPKEISLPKREPKLEKKYDYNEKERLIEKHTKEDVEGILADMTAPKHRFIKDLTNKAAREFAENWWYRSGRKSLEPMIAYLKSVLREYDTLKASYEDKKKYHDKYKNKEEEYLNKLKEIEEKSVRLDFQRDIKQENEDREKAIREREIYEEEHKYDDFTARVHYDSSYKKNLTGLYWDSYYIKECTDTQYLVLEKPKYDEPKVIIAKNILVFVVFVEMRLK